MAVGISGDGLQRLRGISRGLRNNTKKAVTVTFELKGNGIGPAVSGTRCEKVSQGHTQPWWSADLEEE